MKKFNVAEFTFLNIEKKIWNVYRSCKISDVFLWNLI